jgi:hypothetical protein
LEYVWKFLPAAVVLGTHDASSEHATDSSNDARMNNKAFRGFFVATIFLVERQMMDSGITFILLVN